jgi:hypothetical protein
MLLSHGFLVFSESAQTSDKSRKEWLEERARRARERAEYMDAKGTYGDVG